ncbi:MAG: hypothetical protein M1823_005988 [Watsoniomyces obsoletus]|nr:MAG: hypothetical protein M1823_005988 [Watsoniomyces obsoletus]
MTTPYPPCVHHATEPISSDEALHLIQDYLSNVDSQPWLHPDAILSERGPQLAGTLTGGLALHNLRRVEAGLRGERLGGVSFQDPDMMPFRQHHSAIEDVYNPDQNIRLENQEVIAREGYEIGKNGDVAVTGVEEWQDMESYQRDQEITEGEIGQRDTGVADEALVQVKTEVMETSPTPKVEEKSQMSASEVMVSSPIPKEEKRKMSGSEKEERKRGKQMRKRARQERRETKARRRAEKAARHGLVL